MYLRNGSCISMMCKPCIHWKKEDRDKNDNKQDLMAVNGHFIKQREKKNHLIFEMHIKCEHNIYYQCCSPQD